MKKLWFTPGNANYIKITVAIQISELSTKVTLFSLINDAWSKSTVTIIFINDHSFILRQWFTFLTGHFMFTNHQVNIPVKVNVRTIHTVHRFGSGYNLLFPIVFCRIPGLLVPGKVSISLISGITF